MIESWKGNDRRESGAITFYQVNYYSLIKTEVKFRVYESNT
ncbi:hypothetical protein bthur0005_37300 [Bacillus thuringiensis serovar pakistani str. T13001]|nr:hypothetical protein bthur0005_37300 [Bacillus thuringiensis serovar pakistani str. T13001]